METAVGSGMTEGRVEKGARLMAALLLCLVFGSIHSYGMLLIPIEQWLSVSRTVASLGYSLAIAALTVGVSLSAVLLRWLQPASVALIGGCMAALGLGLAGLGSGPIMLLTGFGLLFGLGNGIAYGLSLQEAARSAPRATAWAMGLATAVYGSGSVIAAIFLAVLLESTSVRGIFVGMALVIATVSSLASLLLLKGPPVEIKAVPTTKLELRQLSGIVGIWTIYLLGAMGGLMIIAHSAPVIESFPFSRISPASAPMLVGLGSVVGGYLGGVMAGCLSARFCLSAPLFGLTIALAGLLLPSEGFALFLLVVSGLCYGILISVVPAIVRHSYGDDSFPSAFGLVFTAWGLAGLSGPVFGGWAYDLVGSYTVAILCAALLTATAGILALLMFSRPEDWHRKLVK